MKFTPSALLATSLLIPTTHAYQSGIIFGLNRPVVLRSSSRQPFSSIQKQKAMMDQLLHQQTDFDRVFEKLDREIDLAFPSSNSNYPNKPTLSYHITDNDDLFSITMDLPGVDPANIDVSLVDDVLTLSGSRNSDTLTYRFQKSFALDSSAVNLQQINATLENGVLSVTAPKDVKKEEHKVIKIPVIAAKTKLDQHTVTDQEVDESGSKAEPVATKGDAVGKPAVEMQSVENDIIDLDKEAGEKADIDTKISDEGENDASKDKDDIKEEEK